LDRRRFLQAALTVSLVLFLLVLALKFRPRVEGPRPVTLPGAGTAASGSLSTKGFRYTQESAGKTSFVLTADQVVERPGEARQLTRPRLSMPTSGGETLLIGDQGLFDPTTRTLRVFGNATLSRPDGWNAASSGFRMTPEGELLAEESVTFGRGPLKGRADLMRYQRDSQKAFLEGSVGLQEDGGRRLTCSRIALDLVAHAGEMTGPVQIASPDGSLAAPGGQIALTPQNALREVRLGSPATGEGPAGQFRAETLVVGVGADGALNRISLAGAVRLEARATGERIETARMELTPAGGERWAWNAPDPLVTTRDQDRLEAPSGSGGLGGGRPFVADLPGPVRGEGASGRWRADRAAVEGPVRTLAGSVSGERPGETLQADRVQLRAGGTSTAEGHVRGTRARPGEEPLRFTAERAESASGGYPVVLSDSVRVDRGTGSVEGPRVTLSDPETAEASGGARCRFVGAGGEEETLAAPTVRYEGKLARATASGGAVGKGRGYTLEAQEVAAALDARSRPRSYEARGAAHLDGGAYEARGDRLTWNPGARSGTASSQAGRAVVVQKSPYRRVEGADVAFDDKAISVTSTSPSRRGYLESEPPSPATKTPPDSPRSPDGR